MSESEHGCVPAWARGASSFHDAAVSLELGRHKDVRLILMIAVRHRPIKTATPPSDTAVSDKVCTDLIARICMPIRADDGVLVWQPFSSHTVPVLYSRSRLECEFAQALTYRRLLQIYRHMLDSHRNVLSPETFSIDWMVTRLPHSRAGLPRRPHFVIRADSLLDARRGAHDDSESEDS